MRDEEVVDALTDLRRADFENLDPRTVGIGIAVTVTSPAVFARIILIRALRARYAREKTLPTFFPRSL
ncbi:MAG: hypothetical protein ACR2P7_09755 [bacterium]